MSNMFKKALELFVEFEPGSDHPAHSTGGDDPLPLQEKNKKPSFATPVNGRAFINLNELGKFEKHFEELFNEANFPGPDYYEFWKMMEKLETVVPDEIVRMMAVYSTLQIQGLSKEALINSAEKYRHIVDNDKQEFQQAVNTKVAGEIEGRKNSINELEKKNDANNQLTQKLLKEINENQQKINALEKELTDEEAKVSSNKSGYNLACDAMLAKLSDDIQKIKSHL